MFDLETALAEAVRIGASDLHLKVPSIPRVRVAGQLIELPLAKELEAGDVEAVRDQVLTSEVKRRQFEEIGSTDLSYYTEDARFRVSMFLQRGSPSFVFRVIPSAPQVEGLGLPEVVTSWADGQRGLIVVTGPTGCGKSTTNAAILDLINSRRSCSILTIEDPIEFLHFDQRAAVCQREIGLDAPSYHTALRAALRQDPDVIMIGEVRDEETAMTALRAAETGHLVLCTMHTLDAAETVKRFIDLFGERQGPLVRQVLGSTFVGILSQRLIPAKGGGLVLNAEVLVNSARMQDLIVGGAPDSEIRAAISEGDYYGMCTFDQSLTRLVLEGAIEESTAIDVSSSPHDFKLKLGEALAGNGAITR
jgi:twitching motility protein PilT